MKIQLDTINKTIKVEESVNLGEFITILSRMLPNEEWKEFTLETNVLINWVNPVEVPYVPYSPYKWWREQPWYTWQTHNFSLNSGVYNVDVKI